MKAFIVLLLAATALASVNYDPLPNNAIDYDDGETVYSADDMEEMGLEAVYHDSGSWWFDAKHAPLAKVDKSICLKASVNYADKQNCRCYYKCTDDQRPQHLCCQWGELYNDATERCEVAGDVHCNKRADFFRPHGYSCPRGNGTFPHKNCRKFWHCSNWIPSEKDCPANLHWDCRRRRCEWPNIAQCKPGSGGCGGWCGCGGCQKPPTDAPPCPTCPACPTPRPCPSCPTCPTVTCPACPVCPTTTPKPQPPSCDGLNLNRICRGCRERHLRAHPSSKRRYIECNATPDTHRIRQCSYGLLFNSNRLSCDYAVLVMKDSEDGVYDSGSEGIQNQVSRDDLMPEVDSIEDSVIDEQKIVNE